ncbi:MAG: hypothetical protein H3C35_12515 [Bacteroidetes bacterium]|nr:hypothetical protein [Bacteroidota bacterium]
MVRFIFWIIVSYFFAKLLGAVLFSLRKLFSKKQSSVPPRAQQSSIFYGNVEDVDYEEVDEKK